MIQIQRVYEKVAAGGGTKVLVDRLWPRGLSKEQAPWDEWMKDVAPSDDLRKWFHHDPERWDSFRQRYLGELSLNPGPVARLKQLEKNTGTLILLYSATDPEHNNAAILKEFLDGQK